MRVVSNVALELHNKFWKSYPLGLTMLFPIEQEFFNRVFEEVHPKTIIVFGCGVGREFNYTERAEFYGVDFNLRFLKEAHRNYSKANLVLAALEALPFREGVKFDLGSTSFVLQHVPFEDILTVINNIKPICKALMVEEGIGIPRSYSGAETPLNFQFNHDYEELFRAATLKMKLLSGFNLYTHFFLFIMENEDLNG